MIVLSIVASIIFLLILITVQHVVLNIVPNANAQEKFDPGNALRQESLSADIGQVSWINNDKNTLTIVKDGPRPTDPSLNVEQMVEGIKFPTSMAFLGPDDILVLEKNKVL